MIYGDLVGHPQPEPLAEEVAAITRELADLWECRRFERMPARMPARMDGRKCARMSHGVALA